MKDEKKSNIHFAFSRAFGLSPRRMRFNKKYQKLQADFDELKKGFDNTALKLDEKDTQITNLEQQIGEQKTATEKEIALLKKTNEELVANLQKEISSGKIEIEQIRGRLSMRIAEELFFESGKAEIKLEGKDVLRKIGAVLKKIPEKNIRVEGHTDNVPIGSSLRSVYPTN
jgi:chemotaxis protein MotB